MFKHMINTLKRVHEDERGAEGMEKLLILGVIILPLLGILIYFKDEIGRWLEGNWEEVKTDNDDYTDVPF